MTLADHVSAHPLRLIVTTVVVVCTSWFVAGWALVVAFNSSHASSVAVCRSVNELRRELYVAAADLGVAPAIRERFLPTENCEDLP